MPDHKKLLVLWLALVCPGLWGQPETRRRFRHSASRNHIREEDTFSTSEYLLAQTKGSVFLGCNFPDREIVWRQNGQNLRADEFAEVSRKNGRSAANSSNSSSSNSSSNSSGGSGSGDGNTETILGQRRKSTDSRRRFSSEYLASSKRHVLQISPLLQRDFGQWSCRPKTSHGQGERKLEVVADNNEILPAQSHGWNLVVLPRTEKIFVFDSMNTSGVFPEWNPFNYDLRSEEISAKEELFRHKESVIGAQEGASLRLYCAALVTRRSANADGSAREKKRSLLRWTSENSKLDLTSQVTYEYFVQNSDGLLGLLSILDLPSLDRSQHLAAVGCSSPVLPESMSVKVVLAISYPPTFTIRRTPGFGVPVSAGMTVSLKCDVDVRQRLPESSRTGFEDSKSLPRPANRISESLKSSKDETRSLESSGIRWLKDERLLSESETLVIGRAGPSDVGWYQCSLEYMGEEYSSIAYFLNVQGVLREEQEHSFGSAEEKKDKSVNSVRKSSAKAVQLDESTKGVDDVVDMVYSHISYTDEDNDNNNCSCAAAAASTVAVAAAAVSEAYKRPHLFTSNSSSIIVTSSSPVIRLSYKVCSNPRVHRILWVTPRWTLRPGFASPDSRMVASNLTTSADNVTCLMAALDLFPDDFLMGEYIIVVKNEYGLADASVVLYSPALDKSELTSGGGINVTGESFIVVALLSIFMVARAARS